MSIRVVIAEDQRIVRELLAAQLGKEGDITVVGAASTGREAIDLATAERPDVLLLDVRLPDIDGIAVARAVAAAAPTVRILALSVHNESHIVRDMLDAGAVGYVVKSAPLDELGRAIRTVVRDQMYLSAEVTPAALRARGEPARRLGRRERQVLVLIADGKRTPEIAAQLGISPATVDVHRRNIMRKLGMHSIAELTKFALREGLTSL